MNAADNAVETLVARARTGDTAAFAALIGRFERTALAVAYAKLGDAAAAGDVVQEAFLKAWQNLASLANAASFPGWLAQIVRNLAMDQHRRRRETSALDSAGEVAANGPEPSAELAGQETARAVNAALRQLDATTREIVVLRYFDNLASREIAARVGLSPAAVDMRLSRARQELRSFLDPLGIAGDDTASPANRGEP